MSLVLLPTYTVLFAGRGEWFSTNFSVRAVLGPDFFRGFVVWGVLTGGYFYVLLTSLALTLPQRPLRWTVHILSVAACTALGYALLIPYLPGDIPHWARLHVVMAAGACVLVMAALLLILLALRLRGLLLLWTGIAAVSGILFLTAGMVTTALEVFFTLCVDLLIRSIWLRIYREKEYDHG